jgi:hypothetical protein
MQDQVSRCWPPTGNDRRETYDDKKKQASFLFHDIVPLKEKYISAQKNSRAKSRFSGHLTCRIFLVYFDSGRECDV